MTMVALKWANRMMMSILLLVVLSLNIPSSHLFAQDLTSNSPVAGSTPGGTDDASASDGEFWRQVRRGENGNVVGQNKDSAILIQSGGQDWRMLRNGPMPAIAASAILGMIALLALFFALRGRIRIEHGLSGVTVKRFSLIERTGHWLLAISFIVLAFTGLNVLFGRALLIPLIGKESFATLTLYGKFIHNYVAFAFMAGLAMIAIMWIVHNIPNRHDLIWLLRGGGILGGGHPPAKKFNAGQKILFWLIILGGVSISVSGWALMNPMTTSMFGDTFQHVNSWLGTDLPTALAPITEQQYQSIWHTSMAVFLICIIIAHIYIGTVGMEGAASAMTTGDVDLNWAHEHHSIWTEDLQMGTQQDAPIKGAEK